MLPVLIALGIVVLVGGAISLGQHIYRKRRCQMCGGWDEACYGCKYDRGDHKSK